MNPRTDQNVYERPIEIAEKIFWVGFFERRSNLHCNPYLVVEGDQAAVIDAGSRPDFALVMMKILQSGIAPEQIGALIYHHFDPDLCGSLSNMTDICKNPELIVLSEPTNNLFLSYYLEREKRALLRSIDELGLAYPLGGRTLRFLKTPYAHSSGSFVTYDPITKTLFSSDLFGSISSQWELFIELEEECYSCRDYTRCKQQKKYCPLPDIFEFHKKIMPSEKALRYAMGVIGKLDIEMIAPQHGSIFKVKRDIYFLIERLGDLKGVGIDSF